MDVVMDAAHAMIREDQTPFSALPGHLHEHCYSKIQPDYDDPMDTTPPIKMAPSSGERAGLTLLNQEQDTFETVLLQLLQTFTHHQRQSITQNETIKPLLQNGTFPGGVDISAEALSTLSPEQIMALVTSNSVNYEVIQQIRAQKQILKHDSGEKVPEVVKPDSSGDISQQLLQVTPEQLVHLQSQITELLSQQKVNIPAELSPEQQLEFIQSLLVQQLNVPQAANAAPSVATEPAKKVAQSPTLGGKALSKPRPVSKSTAAKRRREAAKKEPKRPPKPYNIFFGEVYSAVMAGNPKMSLTEASRIISEMWEAQGDELKKRYNEAYEKLDADYQKAIQEYQAEHCEQATTENPLTLQQLLSHNNKDKAPPTGPPLISPVNAPAPHVTRVEPMKTEFSALVVEESMQLSQDVATQEEVTLEKVLNSTTCDPGMCANSGCSNMAVFSEERGPEFCSSECVVKHCRNVFDSWLGNRGIRT
ncbi:uncharacterized protein LOC135341118 isoform X2 [Halichondria panicea]|uniref:uncharacterized protein LOC135341118 isoform X2 n=1 Tax=Halichondria panicea TaxID=6063 RepID=UPI00312B468E